MAADKREKLEKIIAIAINPGAFEDEAIAALRKARELVQNDPSLAYRTALAPPKIEPPESSYKVRINNVNRDWLTVLMANLSQEAYGLGLRSKIVCEYLGLSTTVEVRCDGGAAACAKFQAHVDWLVEYVNKKITEKK